MDLIPMEDLLNDPFSRYMSLTNVRRLCLPPRYLGNISQGIRDVLDAEINLFSRDLDSVVVSYDNIKLLQSIANILDDSPYLSFSVQADYIVFKPTIGCILKGVVNKVSKDHVGCLVHERFNAFIHRPRENQNGWRGANLHKGEEFPFEVLGIYSNNAVLSLKGKFVDERTIEAYLKSVQGDAYKETRIQPKATHVHFDSDEGEVTLDNDPVVEKKKRKTSENEDDTNDGTELAEIVSEEGLDSCTPRKKKKKRRKSETDNVIDEPTEIVSSEQSTVVTKRKRKRSAESSLDEEETPQSPSAKRVRFDMSSVETSNSSPAKLEIDDPNVARESSDLENSDFGSSILEEESFSEVGSESKRKKKKKKEKKKKEDVSDEIPVTEEEPTVSKKSKKKKVKKKLDESENEGDSPDQSEMLLGNLSSGFDEIVSQISSNMSTDNSKKGKKKRHKELVDVVMALQNQVAKVASKLISPSSSGPKKKKQKKKKHRDVSSPERESTQEKKSTKQKSKNITSDDVDAHLHEENGDGLSESSNTKTDLTECSDGVNKKRRRTIVGLADVGDVKRKKKKDRMSV